MARRTTQEGTGPDLQVVLTGAADGLPVVTGDPAGVARLLPGAVAVEVRDAAGLAHRPEMLRALRGPTPLLRRCLLWEMSLDLRVPLDLSLWRWLLVALDRDRPGSGPARGRPS